MSLVLREQGAAGEKSSLNRQTEVKTGLPAEYPSLSAGLGRGPSSTSWRGPCSSRTLEGPCSDWMANLQAEPGVGGAATQSRGGGGDGRGEGRKDTWRKKRGNIRWGRIGKEDRQ